jgi:hypothetical protein
MVFCPQGFACTVQCDANLVCAMTTIVCPDAYDCRIVCDTTQPQACQNTIVKCSQAGPCNLECGAGSQACQGAKVTCGANACQASCVGTDKPALTCGSACVCQGC